MSRVVSFLHSGRCAWPIVLAALAASGAPAAAAGTAAADYEIAVRIDPATRTLEGRSVITAGAAGELTLALGSRFEVTRALVDGNPLVRASEARAACKAGGFRAARARRAGSKSSGGASSCRWMLRSTTGRRSLRASR